MVLHFVNRDKYVHYIIECFILLCYVMLDRLKGWVAKCITALFKGDRNPNQLKIVLPI